MKSLGAISLIVIFAVCFPVLASGAPPDRQEFNVTCPESKLLPVLDTAYHECNNGYANGSCERFVENFRLLMPKYDCQRSFDTSPVPAIWLAGPGALEDYVRLLWRMASSKDKMFTHTLLQRAAAEGKKLFGCEEFRHVLDGALAEEYLPRSKKVERELKRQGKFGP